MPPRLSRHLWSPEKFSCSPRVTKRWSADYLACAASCGALADRLVVSLEWNPSSLRLTVLYSIQAAVYHFLRRKWLCDARRPYQNPPWVKIRGFKPLNQNHSSIEHHFCLESIVLNIKYHLSGETREWLRVRQGHSVFRSVTVAVLSWNVFNL